MSQNLQEFSRYRFACNELVLITSFDNALFMKDLRDVRWVVMGLILARSPP